MSEEFERIQLMNVHFPKTEERELIFVLYTQREKTTSFCSRK